VDAFIKYCSLISSASSLLAAGGCRPAAQSRIGAEELATSLSMEFQVKSFVLFLSLVGVHGLCLELGKNSCATRKRDCFIYVYATAFLAFIFAYLLMNVEGVLLHMLVL
jgi:hypothetical protein